MEAGGSCGIAAICVPSPKLFSNGSPLIRDPLCGRTTVQFGRATWSVSIPEGWAAHHDEECATLLGPDEIGVVQISAAFKASDFNDEDLLEFASEQIEAGLTPIPEQAGVFKGVRFEWREEGDSIQFCYLRHRRQMIFVTYIDEDPTPNQSRRDFRRILDSLSENPGPAA